MKSLIHFEIYWPLIAFGGLPRPFFFGSVSILTVLKKEIQNFFLLISFYIFTQKRQFKFSLSCNLFLHMCKIGISISQFVKNWQKIAVWICPQFRNWEQIFPRPGWNGILLPKLFWPTYCSSNREKLLKFEAEGREFAKILRSLEQLIQTVKGQKNVW